MMEGRCIGVSLFFKHKSKNKKIGHKSLPGSISCICKKRFVSRLSQKGTPRYTCLGGVLTLEAAVILPLMLCFFVSILFFFRVMQVQIEVQKALDDAGRKLAVYLADTGEEQKMADSAAAKLIFSKELRGREEVKKYVKGGMLGISLASSEFSGDEVRLKAVYQICLPVRLFRERGIRIVQRAECRKWTGWNPAGGTEDGDVWVYVAETGEVYHRTKSCTHLDLSVRAVSQDKITWLRNENGEKYRRCTVCADENENPPKVYITNQGDCYHSDLNCSGIKRTIFMIRLSEVGNRRACMKCGEK